MDDFSAPQSAFWFWFPAHNRIFVLWDSPFNGENHAVYITACCRVVRIRIWADSKVRALVGSPIIFPDRNQSRPLNENESGRLRHVFSIKVIAYALCIPHFRKNVLLQSNFVILLHGLADLPSLDGSEKDRIRIRRKSGFPNTLLRFFLNWF